MISGVYKITNTLNGKCYVGSSKHVPRRLYGHRQQLLAGRHHSPKLQRAWDKHGEQAFAFETMLQCHEKDMLFYEQRLMDGYSAVSDGYNILPKAGSRLGSPHRPEVLARMKAFQRSHRQKYQWKGEDRCLAEIAEMEGVDYQLVARRLLEKKGWDIHSAVTTPLGQRDPITKPGFGVSMRVEDWAEKIGCTAGFLWVWTRRGLSIEDCVGKFKTCNESEFARLAGLSPAMFKARLRLGWTVADALTTPVSRLYDRKSVKQKDAP